MSRAQRLRAAAEAERLADHVRVSHRGHVYLRRDERGLQPYLCTARRQLRAKISPNRGWEAVVRCAVLATDAPTREAAIRAGLIALAEREERA